MKHKEIVDLLKQNNELSKQLQTVGGVDAPESAEIIEEMGKVLFKLYDIYNTSRKSHKSETEEKTYKEENEADVFKDFLSFLKQLNTPDDRQQVQYIPQLFEGDEGTNVLSALINTLKPQSYLFSTLKTTNKMFMEGENIYEVIVSTTKDKQEIVVPYQVIISSDGLEEAGVKVEKKLNAYDFAVFNAYCTLIENGQKFMTDRKIYYAMTGKECKNISTAKKVAKSMRKLISTRVSIDVTKHLEMCGCDTSNVKKVERYKFIIPAEEAKQTLNDGQEIMYYAATEEPILLTYAKAVKQLSSVPYEKIKLTSINMTDNALIARNYIISRIEAMKNTKNKIKSDRIRMDKLFKECGFTTKNRSQKKRIREMIFSILDDLKDNEYISEWKKIKKGSSIESVKITLATAK